MLGANDQVTADYVSRALGKRTARYKSESRTIELFGLPRRTKVEQIRERDLMMPQEIRQMPVDKLILIAQGQKPIYGDKLRFFETEPFKSAVAYSVTNIPDVPPIEYLPETAVPATMEAYALKTAPHDNENRLTMLADAQPATDMPNPSNLPQQKNEGRLRRKANHLSDLVDEETARTGRSLASTKPKERLSSPPSAADFVHQRDSASAGTISDRIRQAEDRLKPSAEKLKKIVIEKIENAGSELTARRKSYLEIFEATVPDPLDVGLTME